MKRETSALALLSACLSVGCATRLEYAAGSGPYAFDCEAQPRYYQDLNIHVPSKKLRLTGLMQVVAVAEHPDSYWRSGITVYLRVDPEEPYVGLVGRVYPELSPDKMLFSLQWGHKAGQETGAFAAIEITDAPIPFELTLSESRQLTVSVGRAEKTSSVAPFKVVRATLLCSGAHVRYSNVVVGAQ